MWHLSLSRLLQMIILKCFWRTPTSCWHTTWSISTCCKHSSFSFFRCALNLNWLRGQTSLGKLADAEPDISCWKENIFKREKQTINERPSMKFGENVYKMSFGSNLIFIGRVQPSTALLSMNLKLRQCVSAKIKVTCGHPYMFKMSNKCTCVLAKYKTQYSGQIVCIVLQSCYHLNSWPNLPS